MYEAIMKAANHIESNPNLFGFTVSTIPECGTPGCALGWIAFFSGMKVGRCVLETAAEALGFPEKEFEYHMGHPFYERMDDLVGESRWTESAELCAKGYLLDG